MAEQLGADKFAEQRHRRPVALANTCSRCDFRYQGDKDWNVPYYAGRATGAGLFTK